MRTSTDPVHALDERYLAWKEEYDEAFRAYRSHMCAASGAVGRDAGAELEQAHAALREIARLRTVVPAPVDHGSTASVGPA